MKKLILAINIAFFAAASYATFEEDFAQVLNASNTPRFTPQENIGLGAAPTARLTKELLKQALENEVAAKEWFSQAVAKCRATYNQNIVSSITNEEETRTKRELDLCVLNTFSTYWQTKELSLRSVVSVVMTHPQLHESYKHEETGVKATMTLYHSRLDEQDRSFKERITMCHQQFGQDKEIYHHEDKAYTTAYICSLSELNDFLKARIQLNTSFLMHVMPTFDSEIRFA